MLKKTKSIWLWLNVIFFFLLAKTAWAFTIASPRQTLESISGGANFTASNKPIQEIVIAIIFFVLGLLGILFLTLMIIGGIQWMTSGGNEEKLGKAKARVKNAFIGFAIVMISYSITVFMVNMFSRSTF
ncbi:hypothetical protein KJ840_02040 [Patescibacteria group bacterium]|nr:hypothetical protein [Patescibacteria group bacterium]